MKKEGKIVKVYSNSDKEIDRSTYITKIESNIPKESCQLTFADGSVLNNIALTKQNADKMLNTAMDNATTAMNSMKSKLK